MDSRVIEGSWEYVLYEGRMDERETVKQRRGEWVNMKRMRTTERGHVYLASLILWALSRICHH